MQARSMKARPHLDMGRDRQSGRLGGGPERIVVAVANRNAVQRSGSIEETLGLALDAFYLLDRKVDVAQVDVRDRDQALGIFGAKVKGIVVVGAAVGGGQLRIGAFLFPTNRDSAVEDGDVDALLVHLTDARIGIDPAGSALRDFPIAVFA